MSKRAGPNEMLEVISLVAECRRSTQRVVEREFGLKPDPDQVRIVEVLEDIGDLIARIIPVKDKVALAVRDVAIRRYRPDPPPDLPPPDGDVDEDNSEE